MNAKKLLFKKTLFLVALFFFSGIQLQAQFNTYKASNTDLDLSDFRGSKYLDEKFEKGIVYDKLTNKEKKCFLKYDVFNEVFEMKETLSETKIEYLKKTSEVYVVIKDKEFYFRSFIDENGDKVWGYLQKLAKINGQYFYAKYGKSLTMPQKATTSLEKDKPGKIKDIKYYVIGTKNNLKIESVTRKSIISYVESNQQKTIKAFIKKEKLKFKNFQDLISLANYIDSL